MSPSLQLLLIHQTDLSLSLLSLDHLLRSQQLTFAFVGVAPSFLILYGVGGYLRSAWKGEKRGKARRRRYFNGVRDIERILLTAPEDDQEMTQRDRGLLIVSVSGMRTWAAGLGSSREVSSHISHCQITKLGPYELTCLVLHGRSPHGREPGARSTRQTPGGPEDMEMLGS